MAYYLTHIVYFETPVTELVRIELYRKDVIPDQQIHLNGTTCTRQVLSGDGNGDDTILPTELNFGLWLREDSGVTWDDFIVSFHDEWKVVLYCENQIEFIGFITPNEGNSPLMGTRREVNLTATDNLGLLKKPVLKKYNGEEFRATDRIIDYIVGALSQTGLQLNVRVYSNLYESSMQDRNVSPTADTFNQAKLNYATFLTDPIIFQSSYTALENILKEGYSIEQWFGRWVIMRFGEMQDSPGPKIWYTEYDYTGNIVSANQETHDPAIIAKYQTLHPVGGDLTASCNYAIKQAKHTFNYVPWPEIPKNNTFERGTFIPGIGQDDPVAQTTQRAYTIDDWIYGISNPTIPSQDPPHPAPTSDRNYRLSTYNIYGVEVARVIVLENGGTPGHTFQICQPIPFKAGDRMDIDFDFMRSNSGTGTMNYLSVVFHPDNGGIAYWLENNNTIDGGKPFRWVQQTRMKFVSKFYQGENWNQWSSYNVALPPAPETGVLYICLMNYDSTNTKVYYRNFQVTYHPFVAGGYVEATGDYWRIEQNAAYLDDVDEEVIISDSEIKVLKGAIFRADGTTLTTRSWHRLNVNENRGFKELINMGRYNQLYRRFWKADGTIGGIGYYPGNNQAIRYPIGFHKHFYFTDIPEFADVVFQLVPPLTIDYVAGEMKASFKESFRPGMNDGNQVGNLQEFKYKFK